MAIFEVSQDELTKELALELKKMPEFRPPEWAAFVKTGAFKQRPPVDMDWWYKRAASILRVIYLRGPVGVEKLRQKYGGKRNRGVKPEIFYKSSGNIIRKVLQQVEKAQFAKQVEKGVHKGRIITPKGKSFVDKAVQRLKARAKKS